MDGRPLFVMTDPCHYGVSYRINPWMKPEAWNEARSAEACAAAGKLRAALEAQGARVETLDGVKGLPDLVFPANAAVVLDGRVLVARFRYPERQGEEAVFRAMFHRLKKRGLVREIVDLPDGLYQEGAGDAIWDHDRGFFWAGYGPRSSRGALPVIRRTFGQQVVGIELATDQFYHLDTCFCPLAGGKVLYYPAAFTEQALATIRERVAPEDRIEATPDEAGAFCVNAVNLGRKIVMARAPDSLRAKLQAAGYELVEVDLSPFIASGGAAYCMTLRLDRTSAPAQSILAAE
jgi:N-dimethylarginine dimethylaminohydrolase